MDPDACRRERPNPAATAQGRKYDGRRGSRSPVEPLAASAAKAFGFGLHENRWPTRLIPYGADGAESMGYGTGRLGHLGLAGSLQLRLRNADAVRGADPQVHPAAEALPSHPDGLPGTFSDKDRGIEDRVLRAFRARGTWESQIGLKSDGSLR